MNLQEKFRRPPDWTNIGHLFQRSSEGTNAMQLSLEKK